IGKEAIPALISMLRLATEPDKPFRLLPRQNVLKPRTPREWNAIGRFRASLGAALVCMGDAAVPDILEVIKDTRVLHMQVYAVAVLWEMGNEAQRARRAIIGLLTDADLDVRVQAIICLEDICPDPELDRQLLDQLLSDRNEIVGVYAAGSMVRRSLSTER